MWVIDFSDLVIEVSHSGESREGLIPGPISFKSEKKSSTTVNNPSNMEFALHLKKVGLPS